MALNIAQIKPYVLDFANIALAERSNVVSSGLAGPLNVSLTEGDVKVDIRGWGPLSRTGVVMQEDTVVPVAVDRFSAVRQLFSIQRPVKGVASTWIEQAAAAKDPAQFLGFKFGELWGQYLDASVLASAFGSASSSALAGTCLVDISAGVGAAAVADIADLYSLNEGRAGYYVMHRSVWNLIRLAGLADDMVNPFNGHTGPAFDGSPVIITGDGTTGAAGIYRTYFFRADAVGVTVANDDKLLTSAPILGRGEAYASQAAMVAGIQGASFTGTPAVDGGASLAELATAGNWGLGAPDTTYARHRVLVHKITP